MLSTDFLSLSQNGLTMSSSAPQRNCYMFDARLLIVLD